MIELPSNAQHWSTAESLAGAAAVWRRNPAGEVSICLCQPISTKREIDITWFCSHTKLVFLVNLWKDKQVIAKGEGFEPAPATALQLFYLQKLVGAQRCLTLQILSSRCGATLVVDYHRHLMLFLTIT